MESTKDVRLYVPNPEGYEAHIKHDAEKEYCFIKNPGEDYFHLLVVGEIYLQRGHDKYCLTCAQRQGLISTDRMYWQHRPQGDTSE